ncbi:hypothetical protein BsWGS_04000 [Bradybaena similaris]
MADDEYKDVRVQESLRVKIGEAKNLPASSFSGSARNTCCAIKIDSEEIFRTSTVEKSTDPFFAAKFQSEIPKKFRYLSFYMYEVGNKNKVLGKVSLKKEELYKYHQKEHWFPLTYQDGDTEVQGKVHVEVKLEECLTLSSDTSHRMCVRVIECSDLTIIHGSCNPYAVVTVTYGKSKTKEVKKTSVRKKTICPQFEDTFYFNIDKWHNHEKTSYVFDDFMAGELSISVFHDDSKVPLDVLGFKGGFLGEVKISMKDIDFTRPHNAWYCLQAKAQSRVSDQSLGSIRLRISYSADYVFPSKYYDGLRNLILKSGETRPFTSSAVFILGEIVNHVETATRENAAQPLVKLFLHHGKLLPVINALACWEMSTTVDPNILFRGNSLLTKMVDELMKLIGLPYLHDTLKRFIDKVISDPRPCEIDPCRLKDGEDLKTDMSSLYIYVHEALNIIVGSSLVCPPILRDVFCTLKSQAILKYPNDMAVRYQVVTSFIFLRFFTAAIMGPNLFDLYSDTLEPCVQRTLTLISKGISGLVSLVSSKSNNMTTKEEYMSPLFEMFPPLLQAEIKMFLDIISSSSGSHVKVIEAPIILKEGFLIKRAQGRKRFGILNFKKRYFQLSNQSLSYYKSKGDKHVLYQIPIAEILAVEKLQEDSFKMKYMFQVIHAHRALYIQASNCVEEKEWLDILMKVCRSNQNRLKFYHPAAFINNHWLCCKLADPSMPGCTPVTGGLPLDDILEDIDSDREVEKIHSLLLSAIDLLDDLQETCGSQVVYSGEADVRSQGLGSNIEDPASCFSTIAEMQRCIITLEQEHLQYMHFLHSTTVVGSVDSPIGDGSSSDLVRNITRTSERLSRRGSKSSNASSISRQSFHGCRSRGSSFQERGKVGALMGNSMKKSQSGDFHNQMEATPAATSLVVVAADVTEDDVRRPGNASGDFHNQMEATPAATSLVVVAADVTEDDVSRPGNASGDSQRGGAPPSHSNSTQLKLASNQPGTATDCVHPVNLSSCHTQAAATYLSSSTQTYLSNSTQMDSIIKDNKAINLAMEVNQNAPSAYANEIVDDTHSDIESTLQDTRSDIQSTLQDSPDRVCAPPAHCESPVVINGQSKGENCQLLMTCSPAAESVGEVDVKSLTADAQTDCTVDVKSLTADAQTDCTVDVKSPTADAQTDCTVDVKSLTADAQTDCTVDVKSLTADAQTDCTVDVKSLTADAQTDCTVDVKSLTADAQTDCTVDVQTANTADIETFQTVGVDSITVKDIVRREATEESIQRRTSQASKDLTPRNVCCDGRQGTSALDDDDVLLTPSNITSHATFCDTWQPSEKQQLLTEAGGSTVPGRILTLTEVEQDITSASDYNQVINCCLENGQNCETTGITSVSTACVQRGIGQTNGQCYISSLAREKGSVNLESYQIDSTSGSSQKSTSQMTTDNNHFEPSVFPAETMFASGGADLSQDASNQTVIFI